MCSYATLPSTMPISTTCGRTTLWPVGAMPDGAGRLRHLRVGRPMADEPVFIERTHLVAAVAAGHHRHVRDVRRVGHRRHGGIDAALHKLSPHMGVEDRTRFLVHVKPP